MLQPLGHACLTAYACICIYEHRWAGRGAAVSLNAFYPLCTHLQGEAQVGGRGAAVSQHLAGGLLDKGQNARE